MQHLRVNSGGILRFELSFYLIFFCFFLLKKYGLIFIKSSGNISLPPTGSLRHVLCTY